MKFFVLLLFVFLFPVSGELGGCLFAQQPWTLQQCIEHAVKNNIQVKQNLLNARLAEVNNFSGKAQMLPSLNGSISNSYNNGKRVDPFTNQFLTGDWVNSQNYALTANITLFGGFQTLNSIKQSQYDLLAARQDVLRMQNDISLNIASAYLQVLFAEELLAVSQSQSEITRQQAERIQKLVNAGAMPKGTLLDIQAQQAMEEVNLVNAENTLVISKLNLIQLMNLDTVLPQNFGITRPEISLSTGTLAASPAQVYETALTTQPQIKSAEYKLMSAEKGIAFARGGRYPRLSLSASYGTGFSGASKKISGTTFTGYYPSGFTSSFDTVYTPAYEYNYETIPFSEQIDNNLNRSVGFYLTVPLFNNWQANSAVARAKIARENAALSLQLQKDNLRKLIQQAHNDAVSAVKKHQASEKAVSAMQESFKYMEQKFSVGAATSVEYNDAKNKLTKAQSDLLQAKYDAVFKIKVLDFYLGKPIAL